MVSLGFLSFSFLGFFLFVYGPTLERCLYRPEIGPYMVWFYTWTTFVDNFVDKVLDDIFWFGYLVSLYSSATSKFQLKWTDGTPSTLTLSEVVEILLPPTPVSVADSA